MSATRTQITPAARATAWAGAALFVLALGYFLLTYIITFGEITRGPVSAAAILTDIALFTAFATHHSVFARNSVRALVARTVPPELERSAYVWVASLLLIIVCAWWRPVPGALWAVTGVAAGGWWVNSGRRGLDTPDRAALEQLVDTTQQTAAIAAQGLVTAKALNGNVEQWQQLANDASNVANHARNVLEAE